MFFAEPPRTQYDLHFRIGSVPVRVHPFFWIVAAVLGSGAGGGLELLTWILVVFLSILAHEFGHAMAMQYYGESPRVVLYLMGGLTIADSAGFGGARRSPLRQILISAAGPGAGFLLAAMVAVSIALSGGRFMWAPRFPIFWSFELAAPNRLLNGLIFDLLQVNILWGLLNLLPIYPLDGGHISREILAADDPAGGTIRALWLSVWVAGALAGWGAYQWMQHEGGLLLPLLFGSLAYSNYTTLQRFTGRGGFGGGRPW